MKLYLNVLFAFVLMIFLLADFTFVKNVEKNLARHGCVEIEYTGNGDPICVKAVDIYAKK